MILEMLRWWYGTGWMQAMHRVGAWTAAVAKTFSTRLLLQTLFSPWRRIISVGASSFDTKLRAGLDNIVSRCIGFTVRCVVLLAAGVGALGAFLAGIVMVIIWPLLPVAVVYFAVRGIIG
jgi:hypothetical protein